DLPAPFGPMTQAVLPRSSDRLTSRTATKPPNDLLTASTRNSTASVPAARRRPAKMPDAPEVRVDQRVDGEDDPQQHDQESGQRRAKPNVQREGGDRQGKQQQAVNRVEAVGSPQQQPEQ